MAESPPSSPRKYLWPKFVLAAVLLFLALSVFWLTREVARIKRIKAVNTPPQTNAAPAPPATGTPNSP